jgi:peptidyl-prolyl cis-trans isomerase SurA
MEAEMRVRTRLPGILAALGIVVGFAATPPLVAQLSDNVNRIVLRVNDRILTLFDYEARKQEWVERVRNADMAPDRRQELLASAGVEVLRSAFEEMLLSSRADQLGIHASDESVDQAIERQKKAFGIETEEDFKKALAQSHLDLDTLRAQFRSNLAMQEVVAREIRPRVKLEQDDLRRYYQAHPDEFRLPVRLMVRELVVLDSSSLSPAERKDLARRLADELKAQSLTDQEIEELSGRGLTTEWIDLGWVQPGDLDPQIEAAVHDLKAGEASEPVSGRGGIHLAQVQDRKESELLDFADVAEQIHNKEYDRLFEQEMDSYLEELQVASFIVSKPPPEAADFQVAEHSRRPDPLAQFEAPLAVPPPPAPPGDGS